MSVGVAHAQLPAEISERSTISVLTIYSGDPVYSAWGHSALRVTDPDSRIDAVFSYGTFDTTRPYFLPRFAYGDMLYQLSIEPMTRLMRAADIQQRDVVEQILNLSPEAKADLWEMLKLNLLDENRSYQYDFILDNCSTRIVDLLEATGSIELGDDTYASSYREMVDQYVHARSWLDLGIDLVFGSRMDDVPDLRTRTFLPVFLLEILDEAKGADGMPLVAQKRTLAEYGLPRSQDGLPMTIPIFWVLSLVTILFTAKGLRDKSLVGPTRFDRWMFGFVGATGLFLMGMWFFTQHWVTAANWNIAWLLPSHLVAAVVWKRWAGLGSYLRYTSYLTFAVLLLQLFLVQPIPPALIPVALVIAFRLWAVSGSRI